MSDPTARRAWELAEKRCFDYLRKVLGSFEDIDAYLAEFPASMSDVANTQMWAFEINGPGQIEPIRHRQTQNPFQCWEMGAMFKGVFLTRVTAQNIAGEVLSKLPIDINELTGVQYFAVTEMPTLIRQEIQTSNDLSTGGLMRVWTLTIPMHVVFNNVKS